MIWSAVLGTLKTLGSTWLKNKQLTSQAKAQKELQILAGDREADAASARGMAASLKDEYLTLVLSAPLIVIFYASVWGDPLMVIPLNLSNM